MKSKRILKRIALSLLATLGYTLLLPIWHRARRKQDPSTFRVLNYHSVGDIRSYETNVSSGAFDTHMKWLALHTNVRAVRDILTAIDDGTPLPPNTLTITFDDGYADNLHIAEPILKRYGLSATCFVTAGYVGTDKKLPHDKDVPDKEAQLLTWDQVSTLKSKGIAVGSHGMKHIRMGHETESAQHTEMRESKNMIESHIGSPVEFVSYPYGRAGDYDAVSMAAAQAAGYTAGFSAKYGWNTRNTNRFELRRIGVESSDTRFTLEAKVNGALDILLIFESSFWREIIRTLNRLAGA